MNTHPLSALVLANNWNSVQPFVAILSLGLTLTFFGVLLAFVSVFRQRLRRLTTKMEAREAVTNSHAAELEAQALLARQMSVDLEELRKRVLEREGSIQTPVSAWASGSGPLNLNRRGQILRLSHKGKSIAEIASDLNIAQGEVELLLKVHDLSESANNLKS